MTKFLKRIGCLKTRFDFEVLLASLELPSSLAWSGTVKISLKKGKRHVETKTSHKIDHLNPSNPINESLLFPATLFLSKKTNKYLYGVIEKYYKKNYNYKNIYIINDTIAEYYIDITKTIYFNEISKIGNINMFLEIPNFNISTQYCKIINNSSIISSFSCDT